MSRAHGDGGLSQKSQIACATHFSELNLHSFRMNAFTKNSEFLFHYSEESDFHSIGAFSHRSKEWVARKSRLIRVLTSGLVGGTPFIGALRPARLAACGQAVAEQLRRTGSNISSIAQCAMCAMCPHLALPLYTATNPTIHSAPRKMTFWFDAGFHNLCNFRLVWDGV